MERPVPSTPRSSAPQDELVHVPDPPGPDRQRPPRPARRLLGAFLLVTAFVVSAVAVYNQVSPARTTVPFSRSEVLAGLWQKYVQAYVEPGSGRVLDHQQGDLTTSEGQSYAMLRAVWQDDRPTFDKVWQFTRDLAAPARRTTCSPGSSASAPTAATACSSTRAARTPPATPTATSRWRS